MLRSNNWQLNKRNYFDKNFDNRGLEIIDDKGTVVLQLYLVDNMAVVSGLFYSSEGYGTTIYYDHEVQQAVISTYIEKGLYPTKEEYNVNPIFKHPGESNPGRSV